MIKSQFVTLEDFNHSLTDVHIMIHGLQQELQNQMVNIDELQVSYDQLVKLYNAELKQYKACVLAFRKLTSILLELPDFKEKWDKFHEAPDYDRR